MKCENCLKQLEEYVDGELVERVGTEISAHVMTCVECSRAFDSLAAEREMFRRYDRGLEIAPSMWSAIEARIAVEDRLVDSKPRFSPRDWFAGFSLVPVFRFAGVGAIAIVAVAIGILFIQKRWQSPTPSKEISGVREIRNERMGVSRNVQDDRSPSVVPGLSPSSSGVNGEGGSPLSGQRRADGLSKSLFRLASTRDQSGSDVLYSELAYSDIEDIETIKHIERAQMLLRAVRNVEVTDDDDAVDISYEKALSRRLLSDNIVLRRDAEIRGRYPAKTLLGSLEPFLLDIANLQDRSTPDELRAIKDRVRKTEIVAALQSY